MPSDDYCIRLDTRMLDNGTADGHRIDGHISPSERYHVDA